MTSRSVGTLILVCAVLHASGGQAQVVRSTSITADGTTPTAFARNGNVLNINGGTPSGNGRNLFHSFGTFSVGTNDNALFNRPGGEANIISRVTGSDVSFIDGGLGSNPAGANLFLINPRGVLLGPGARLDLGTVGGVATNLGSFHVSTADYVLFPGGSAFCAARCGNLPPGTVAGFSAADPIAFGFLNSQPVRIAVEGSSLRVGSGQTISLVGGEAPFPVSVSPEQETGLKIAGPPPVSPDFVSLPTLWAPGGTARIVSVASAGEVGLIPGFVSAVPTPTPGRVQISGGAIIDVSGAAGTGDRGGTVKIRGGQIDILADPTFGGARIDASGDAVVGGAGGTIRIHGVGLFADGASITANTFGNANGDPGGLDFHLQDQIVLTNGTFAATFTFSDGNAGNILVDTGRFTVSAGGLLGTLSAGDGRGGYVTIVARDSVTLSGAAFVSTDAASTGNGGRVSVSSPLLRMDDLATIASSNFGLGVGGPIRVDVQDLTMAGGATIRSVTGAGDAVGGDIHVTARGSAVISGLGVDGSSTGIFVGSQGGPAGAIGIDVGRLTLTGGALIQSGSLIDPQGGAIRVTANDAIVIADRSGILSQALDREVLPVTIQARTVTIDNGFVNTSTLGTKPAGPIRVNTDRLTVTGGGEINSSSERFATETARGGDITITATDSVLIAGRSPSGVPVNPFSGELRSGIFSTAAGMGPGGHIQITASRVDLRDTATISASSTGTATALAGNVNIVFGKSLRLFNSSITTDSLAADGGNISITSTGSELLLQNSQITTSVRSSIGRGGNITLGSFEHPLGIIVLDDSGIHANAFGGPGGNINIFTDVLLANTPLDTTITASSQLSSSGTISINALVTDVSGSLAELPSGTLQAAALLRASCAARMAEGKASSLVVAGREGVPLEPGGLLPSALGEARVAQTATGAAAFLSTELPALRLPFFDPKCGW